MSVIALGSSIISMVQTFGTLVTAARTAAVANRRGVRACWFGADSRGGDSRRSDRQLGPHLARR